MHVQPSISQLSIHEIDNVNSPLTSNRFKDWDIGNLHQFNIFQKLMVEDSKYKNFAPKSKD
jgi:hypothetical protein